MATGVKSDIELTNQVTSVSLGGTSDMKAFEEEKTGTVLSGYTVITKSMIGAGMPTFPSIS